ncbi:hypothetical protein D7M11_08410 [Paenibacillus ginsengarvi]|uniref:Uncharacterized protein n=1 Tax=Paenibacillus ginsengarvi TaxID=400777 RepID=A0A3B0CL79_9BACL|nr:hypothetical protein D7M11_08410 [Paenibacillus ginsengarvi]
MKGGTVLVTIDNHQFTATEHDIIFVNKGQIHAVEALSGADARIEGEVGKIAGRYHSAEPVLPFRVSNHCDRNMRIFGMNRARDEIGEFLVRYRRPSCSMTSCTGSCKRFQTTMQNPLKWPRFPFNFLFFVLHR